MPHTGRIGKNNSRLPEFWHFGKNFVNDFMQILPYIAPGTWLTTQNEVSIFLENGPIPISAFLARS
jgi:hypothetical protein